MKTVSAALRALAKGINPETGELLAPGSLANQPDVIRMLFALSEELAERPEKQKKIKLTPEERQQKNIAEGRPANAYFPWAADERVLLDVRYRQNEDINALSQQFGRSTRAVAIQLEKMGLITAEQLLAVS